MEISDFIMIFVPLCHQMIYCLKCGLCLVLRFITYNSLIPVLTESVCYSVRFWNAKLTSQLKTRATSKTSFNEWRHHVTFFLMTDYKHVQQYILKRLSMLKKIPGNNNLNNLPASTHKQCDTFVSGSFV